MNPLLDTAQLLPRFSEIKAEHMVPAIEKSILENKIAIDTLAEAHDKGAELTYDSLVRTLDNVGEPFNRAWNAISHINSVITSDDVRSAYNTCVELLTEFGSWMGQHEGLYRAYEFIKTSGEYYLLNNAQQKLVDNAIRGFKLSGVALANDEKDYYKELSSVLSELTTKYSENCLDSRQAWSLFITDVEDLNGVPESNLKAFEQAAKEQGKEGYLLTLDIPCYVAVMSHCENRGLRRKMYEAYTTIASDKSPVSDEYDNTEIAKKIVKFRNNKASLLGFDTYAELSLARKMVDTPEQVFDFLNDLVVKSKPFAEKEAEELQTFAEEEYGVTEKLEAWDRGYYSERELEAKFDYSEEEVRPYFPDTTVIDGMFSIASTLFDVHFENDQTVDTWHQDVEFYWVTDSDGNRIAGFYMDLYARKNKKGGAWMHEQTVRRELDDGTIQLPVAYLTCNFNAPVGDDPALLTHDEVTTIFHEFGHGLHHMLTKVTEVDVSGINGVPWDAVELPSQFLENWCWEKSALPMISGHYKTGEPLPDELIDKMIASKNFGAASGMLRQLEFALFDFHVHTDNEGRTIREILNDVRSEVSVYEYPDFNRFDCNFSHIFAGGYAAGYYSYKWAEVLSADAYSKFEEEGIFNKETGKLFKTTILEKGGSEDPMDLFIAFRGREPSVDALLRHSGLE